MRRQDFAYELPEELIAFTPTPQRTGSRLMRLDGNSGDINHLQFSDVIDQLEAGDVMVFNNTEVIPARVFGQKATGGKVEILVERVIDEHCVWAHIRSSKSPKAGASISLENGTQVAVTGRTGADNALFVLDFGEAKVLETLQAVGHMPLPPYIDREDELDDKERYQTVYGCRPGAVAAPTAGLHFDEPLLAAIKAKGVTIVYVTLHVGAGTFQPVRVDNIDDHVMHSEVIDVPASVCDTINQAREEGRRIVAVGTTSMRSLEAAAQYSRSDDSRGDDSHGDALKPFNGETDIFITPGYAFQVVDALVTNFHLSESTLLMLISAFAGYEQTMHAYQQAVAQRYRFFSYGDAMFITRRTV